MLRIEKESDGRVTRLLVSGHIQADGIACIKSAMKDASKRKLLDLRDVTLVDITAIRFLIRCEKEGIELAQCPPFVREWMLLERVEEA